MRVAQTRLAAVLVVAALGGLQLSCSGPLALDDAPLGLTEGIDRPAPAFVVEASPVVQDDVLLLEIRASITPADLVFEATEDGFQATLELAFRIREPRGRETFMAREISDTLAVATIDETRSDQALVYAERFAAPAGRLMAEVLLLDQRGEPRATRRFESTMPRAEDLPIVLPPRILRDDEFVVGSETPQWRLGESLTVLTATYPSRGHTAPTITLLRGRADLDVPSPPFWISPARGSIVYRGADFSRDLDSVMVARETDELDLPLLEEGVYVIEVALDGADSSVRRPLVVLPAGHPRLETVDDLIASLAYIAYPAEVEIMEAGITAEDRRERFDAFWASLFDVCALAQETMRLYFGRVEEANRLFTTHKPGWRTDRGMIYVVLGPPEFVERTPEGEMWRYGRGVASDSYFFERVRYDDAPWPMEHHVLRRSPRHEDDWHRAIRRWRRGEVR